MSMTWTKNSAPKDNLLALVYTECFIFLLNKPVRECFKNQVDRKLTH